MDWSKVLFVGWHDVEGVTHYRTILPARTLGAEYVVFSMDGKGVARSGTNMKHEIIVVQHCWHAWQVRVARRMMKSGAKVLVNVDDWVPAVGKLGSAHAFSKEFGRPDITKEYLSLLREVDGIIAATPWLVEKCKNYNPSVELARNGLDLERYRRYNKQAGDKLVLGWAGGTGHAGAFGLVVPALEQILEERPNTVVHLVGDDHSGMFASGFQDRVKHIVWSDMSFYPRHLAQFDINLAPARESDFYKAKSQLRFYEACAVGVPTVGHYMYDEIQNHVTGYKVDDRGWVKSLEPLIDHPDLLQKMASSAAEYAEEISIEKRISEWKTAISALTSP